jgi:hypothetical protein
VISIGIDDTDIVGTPGTNQLARLILRRIGSLARDSVISRHQLFFDSRVPYTSKNGSASIQLPHAGPQDLMQLTPTICEVMTSWFVIGSDPGLCIAEAVTEEMKAFALRCKSEVVTQDEAREIAARAGCFLQGLGGTEQGIIGALAAVGLIAGGEDGRVVQLDSWPYPDESFSGAREIGELYARGIDEIRHLESGERITRGPVDIGRHLRPNLRSGLIVLFVTATSDLAASAPWRAVKLA